MENMLNSTRKSAVSQSDSDSGDSLFVTQSVTSAKRTAKRHRSSETPRISQESEDEEAGDKGDTRHVEDRQDAVPKRDSGSDSSDVDLSSLYQAFSSRLQKGGRRPVTVAQRASFSFLESRSGKLSVSKNQILVNAEVGGFFKCVKKLSEGQEERNSPHLLWPPLLSDKLQEYDDDVDIQTVDMHCFIPVAHNRHKEAWLHTNMIPAPKDSSKKSKIRQKGKVKKDPKKSKNASASKVTKGLTESEEDTHDDSSSSDIDKRQSQKSITCHSPPLVSSSESSFIQSLLAEQEENSEKHLPVLATCTQSVGLHPAEELIQPSENIVSESDDETVIDETQWPGLTDQKCKDEVGLENIKCTRQTNSGISDTHHELEDEDSGSNPSSQDLFKDLRNRTVERMVSTPLKEVRIGNCNESDLDTDKNETVDFIMGSCPTPQADQISEPQCTEIDGLQADIKENQNVQSVLHLRDDTDVEASECVLPSGENKQQQELVKDKNVSIESSQDESPRAVQGSGQQTVEVVPIEELEDTEVHDEKEVQLTDSSSPRKKTDSLPDNVAEVHEVLCIDALEDTDCNPDFFEEPKNQTDLKVKASPSNVLHKKNKRNNKHSGSETSELQRFIPLDNLQSNEIFPEPGEINQANEESPKQDPNNDLPCNNPSQPSESKAHGSSPSKDDLPTEAAESPMFNFGGISFLKRRKRKMTEESELRQDQQLSTLLKNKGKEAGEKPTPSLVKNKDLKNAFLSVWESEPQPDGVCDIKAKKRRKKDKQVRSANQLTEGTPSASVPESIEQLTRTEHFNTGLNLEGSQQGSNSESFREGSKDGIPSDGSEIRKKKKSKRRDLQNTQESTCSTTETRGMENRKPDGQPSDYQSELNQGSCEVPTRLEIQQVNGLALQADQASDTQSFEVSKVKAKKRRKKERQIESMSLLTKEPGSEEGIQELYPASKHLNSSAKACGETGEEFGSFYSSEPLKKKKAKKRVSSDDYLHCTEMSDSSCSITKTKAVEQIKQGLFAEYIDEVQHKKEIVLVSRFPLESHEEPLTVSMTVQPMDQDSDSQVIKACKIKTKSKRKKDKHVHLMSKFSDETGLASDGIEHISRASRNLKDKEVCSEAGRDLVQSDASEPRKKKKTKKRDMSDDVVTFRAKESEPGHHTSEITTPKKKNKKKDFPTEDLGQERRPSKNLEEPLMDNNEIPVGTVNQDSEAQSTGDRKAKKKRKKDKQKGQKGQKNGIDETVTVNRKKQDVSTGDFGGQVTNTSRSFEETSIDIQQVDQNYEVKAKKKKKKHKRIQSLSEGTSMEPSIAFERLPSTTDQPEQFERTESRNSAFRGQDCHVEVYGESKKDLMPLKKKKRHLSDDVVTSQRAEESEPGGTSETLTVKKKRKKKESFTEDFGRERHPSKIFEEPLKDNHEIPVNQDSEAQSVEDCERKIKKKRNKDKHGHGITEIVQLATTRQPSRSLEETSIEIQPVDQNSEVQLTLAKKKKKKDKHIQSVSKLSEGISMEQDIQKSFSLKKKKHRHKEDLEETLKGSCDIPAPVEIPPLVCLQVDDSLTSKNKKKKKKKRQEEVGDETKTTEHIEAAKTIQEIHQESTGGLPCPNKKKKKKKRDTDDASTLDSSWVQLPSNVPSEGMGSESGVPVESVPVKKKNKKKR